MDHHLDQEQGQLVVTDRMHRRSLERVVPPDARRRGDDMPGFPTLATDCSLTHVFRKFVAYAHEHAGKLEIRIAALDR